MMFTKMGISVTEIFNNALGKHLPRMFSDELILHSHTRTRWSVMSFSLNFLILYGLLYGQLFSCPPVGLHTKPCSAKRYNKCNFSLFTDSCLAACDKIFIESFRRKHLVLLSLGFFRLLFILSQFLGKWRNSSSIYFLCCPFYLFTFGHFLRS